MRQVLKGVDLEVQKGESLVILGGSGSGKSVMLKNALGLMTPTSGTIWFDGQDVTKASGRTREKMRARIGMLFQSGALFDSLTVWENVGFRLLQVDKLRRKEAKERAERAELGQHEAPPREDLEHVAAARCVPIGRRRAHGEAEVARDDEDLADADVEPAEFGRDVQRAQLRHHEQLAVRVAEGALAHVRVAGVHVDGDAVLL